MQRLRHRVGWKPRISPSLRGGDLILAVVLIARFARTGGVMMLKMMSGSPDPAGAEAGPHAGGCDEGHARTSQAPDIYPAWVW